MKNIILKKNLYLILFIIFIPLLFLLVFKNSLISISDFEFQKVELPIQQSNKEELINRFKRFSLEDYNKGLSLRILDSLNQTDFILLDQIMDSINVKFKDDPSVPGMAFADLLTKNNTRRLVIGNNTSSLDTLFDNYQWAASIKSISSFTSGMNSTVFSVVFDYWMLDLANNLQRIDQYNNQLRYSIKFRTLMNLCKQHNYPPNISLSNFEKVIYNIQESRFSYIMNRFLLTFGVTGVLIFFFLAVFTVYTYIYFFLNFKKQ